MSTDYSEQMGLKSTQSYGWFTTYSPDYMWLLLIENTHMVTSFSKVQ